jgi:hypothetical protein
VVEPVVALFGVVAAAGGVTSGVVVAGDGVEAGGGMVFTGGDVGVVVSLTIGEGAAVLCAGGATPAGLVAPVLTPAAVALGVVTGRSGEAVTAVDERVSGAGLVTLRVVVVTLRLVVVGAGPAAAASAALGGELAASSVIAGVAAVAAGAAAMASGRPPGVMVVSTGRVA